MATEEERKINVYDNIKHSVNIKEEAQNKNFTQARLREVWLKSQDYTGLAGILITALEKKSIQRTVTRNNTV